MDTIQGYTIQKAVLFENGAGVALGENPNAPNPYVTWRFFSRKTAHEITFGATTTTRAKPLKQTLLTVPKIINSYIRYGRLHLKSNLFAPS